MKESNRPFRSETTFKVQKLQGELEYSFKTFVSRLLIDGTEHCKRCANFHPFYGMGIFVILLTRIQE